MYTFKELMAIPSPEGETEDQAYMRYRAQKRRRGVTGGTIGGPLGEATEQKAVCGCGPECEHCGGEHSMSEVGEKCECCGNEIEAEDMNEALTTSQRIAKSRQMKRYKSKIKLGRERAMRKMADMGRIKKRAQKHARLALFKKLSKGKSPSEVPFAKRAEIEKRLDKMKVRIERMAKKLIPQVRKQEQQRHQATPEKK